jgi:hypothetical protein
MLTEREGGRSMSERTITTRDLGAEEELTLYQDAGGKLYVNDERIWSVSALGDGIVALTTGIRTVHIDATDYWRVLHGEGGLSPHAAGILAARLAHLEHHATALIAAIEYEERLSRTAYPAIWQQIAGLRTALDAAETAPVRAAM